MSLSRDVLLNFKPKTKEVPLPERNSSVHVRELRASEAIECAKNQMINPTGSIYKLILLATIDSEGVSVFTDADTEAVSGLPYKVVDTIAAAILELSRLNDDAKKKPSTPKPDDAK